MDNLNQYSVYESGTDMWNRTAESHSFDEAAVICNNCLERHLCREHSEDEHRFCRDLFTAMYQAAACKPCLKHIVYPYDFTTAKNRMETSCYHSSKNLNRECVFDIDKAIKDCCYALYYYNLESAAWRVLLKYGFRRVNAVLMNHIRKHEYDGRYSQDNKQWSQLFPFHGKAFNGAYFNSHATLMDSFTDYVRKLYIDLGAEQFALPGNPEHGESNQDYGIIRSYMFSADKGVVIGHNPNAVNPFVCWTVTANNSERSYNRGIYGEEKDAFDGYYARLFVHLSDNAAAEI